MSREISKLLPSQEKPLVLVRTGGLEPPPPYGEQIFIPLRLSPPPLRRSWSGLSLRHSLPAVGAARLVSTPSPEGAWLGIGIGCPLAFPDFEQFYSTSFPAGTPTEVCCVYRFATSASSPCLPIGIEARNLHFKSDIVYRNYLILLKYFHS